MIKFANQDSFKNQAFYFFDSFSSLRTNKLIEAGFQVFNTFAGKTRPLGLRVTDPELLLQLTTFEHKSEIDVDDIKGALIIWLICHAIAFINLFVERYFKKKFSKYSRSRRRKHYMLLVRPKII